MRRIIYIILILRESTSYRRGRSPLIRVWTRGLIRRPSSYRNRTPRFGGVGFFYFFSPSYYFRIRSFFNNIFFKDIFDVKLVSFASHLKFSVVLSSAIVNCLLPAKSNMDSIKICLISMICSGSICRHSRMTVN